MHTPKAYFAIFTVSYLLSENLVILDSGRRRNLENFYFFYFKETCRGATSQSVTYAERFFEKFCEVNLELLGSEEKFDF